MKLWEFRVMQMSMIVSQFDPSVLRGLRRNLRRWYAGHGRDLPWRRSRDPYRIWVSEIMLQQTTVTAVIPYFERFLKRFPDVGALAAAAEEEVLRHWEGLGYYSRARNLHRTARLIVDEHDGQFPAQVDSLRKFPGIGRYTAGAVASFAFDCDAPIVEANTSRLYCRLLGYDGDRRSTAGQQLLWKFAAHILPRRSPGTFNQALIELGATRCTATDPSCRQCPLRRCCRAFAKGTQHDIPRPVERPRTAFVTEAAVAVRRNGMYLLEHRKPGERWAGLWDFPRFAMPDEIANATGRIRSRSAADRSRRNRLPPHKRGGQLQISAAARRWLVDEVIRRTGITVDIEGLLTEIRHSVTRYRIRLLCALANHRQGVVTPSRELCWVRPAEFERYPLSVSGRKFADLLTVDSSRCTRN